MGAYLRCVPQLVDQHVRMCVSLTPHFLDYTLATSLIQAITLTYLKGLYIFFLD